VVARPSGTEPKIKYYFDLREQVQPGEPFPEARARAEARLASLIDGFLALVS
jgi:phosphomannomutase